MALSAGADTRALGTLMVDMVTIGRTLDAHLNGAAFQPNLWVNSKGIRFANEVVAMSFADTGNTVAQTDDGIMWAVFDAEGKRRCIEVGSEIGLGDFIMYGQKFTRLNSEIDASLEAKDGAVVIADTIEELAEKMGVPTEQFTSTINRYNGSAKPDVTLISGSPLSSCCLSSSRRILRYPSGADHTCFRWRHSRQR